MRHPTETWDSGHETETDQDTETPRYPNTYRHQQNQISKFGATKWAKLNQINRSEYGCISELGLFFQYFRMCFWFHGQWKLDKIITVNFSPPLDIVCANNIGVENLLRPAIPPPPLDFAWRATWCGNPGNHWVPHRGCSAVFSAGGSSSVQIQCSCPSGDF